MKSLLYDFLNWLNYLYPVLFLLMLDREISLKSTIIIFLCFLISFYSFVFIFRYAINRKNINRANVEISISHIWIKNYFGSMSVYEISDLLDVVDKRGLVQLIFTKRNLLDNVVNMKKCYLSLNDFSALLDISQHNKSFKRTALRAAA